MATRRKKVAKKATKKVVRGALGTPQPAGIGRRQQRMFGDIPTKKVLKKATKKVKKTVARRGQGRGGRESSGST